jgi:5S rRNA maturation endonuclease (ribonuclease M5)
MTKEEFKQRNPIVGELEKRGIQVPSSRKPKIKCPFHQDRNPSFSIDADQNLWMCHAGCGGGDIFNLLAKFDGISVEDALKRYVPKEDESKTVAPSVADAKAVIERIYSYTDENGKELFQAVRYKPKTFRQRHNHAGQWVYNLEGIRRVLYRLPEVLKSERVWIVEGEKDAENLRELGYVATCNPMGAGKWLDSYTEVLKDKEVVLCGDNDKPGQDHMEKVFESICGKVKNVRRINLSGDYKDASDYIAAFPSPAEAKLALDGLMGAAVVLVKGVNLPIYALWEMEDNYREHVRNLRENQFSLGNWLPSLGRCVRGLVPGELVTILASTGVGKTAILQNIAKASAPLPTILFEMELPPELVYERFIGVQIGWTPSRIEESFQEAIKTGERFGPDGVAKLSHVFCCTEARLTPEKLEQYINRAELKIGTRPKVVLLDYIQLMTGKGSSRYEKMSNVAEELKIIAKSTRTVIFVTSQIHRKEGEDPEVTLFDAKDSGSIENSSGLVLGAWRNPEDATLLHVKILKNTKGTGGKEIQCRFKGESMQIVEIGPEIPKDIFNK